MKDQEIDIANNRTVLKYYQALYQFYGECEQINITGRDRLFLSATSEHIISFGDIGLFSSVAMQLTSSSENTLKTTVGNCVPFIISLTDTPESESGIWQEFFDGWLDVNPWFNCLKENHLIEHIFESGQALVMIDLQGHEFNYIAWDAVMNCLDLFPDTRFIFSRSDYITKGDSLLICRRIGE